MPATPLQLPDDFAYRCPANRLNGAGIAAYWRMLGASPNATLQQLTAAADALVADEQLYAYASYLYYQAIDDPAPDEDISRRPFAPSQPQRHGATATSYRPRMTTGEVENSLLPDDIAARAPLLPAVVLLAGVPMMLRGFARRGWQSMQQPCSGGLCDHIRLTLEFYGCMSLAEMSWGLHFIRGELLRFGSLHFIPEWQTHIPALPEQGKPAAFYDALTLAVHIPSGVDLSPEALRRTFTQCHDFVLANPYLGCPEVYTCRSWMMSPQLPEMLPPDSRVLAFKSYFTPVPFNGTVGGFYRFVLGRPADTPVEALPRATRLQRQVADRIAQGNPPQAGYGIRLFDADQH